jgi:hypothetical protein
MAQARAGILFLDWAHGKQLEMGLQAQKNIL